MTPTSQQPQAAADSYRGQEAGDVESPREARPPALTTAPGDRPKSQFDARPPKGRSMLLTAIPYTSWLVYVLDKAAAEEHRAQYQARLADAVAIPLVVTRYQCPHCRRTRAKRPAAESHIARCWQNPAVRACTTCEHYDPGGDACGCDPGCNWGAPGPIPPSCNAGVPFPESYRPVIDCAFWERRP